MLETTSIQVTVEFRKYYKSGPRVVYVCATIVQLMSHL